MSARLIFCCLTAVATASTISVHAEYSLSERRSGYADLAPETKAMQDDDMINPATLSMLDGQALWSTKAGVVQASCADCHGKAEESMKGVAARYPAYDAARRRLVDLEQRINICRAEHQKASPFRPESKDILALALYVGRQSRGMPIAPSDDTRLQPFIEAGRKLFTERQGQLNLSCAHCHDERWGKHLGSSLIPQGHPTGYPIYRLEWQSVGSLQRRLRNCMFGMRAQPFDYGAQENVELELFLMWRARGMTVETPAVRP